LPRHLAGKRCLFYVQRR